MSTAKFERLSSVAKERYNESRVCGPIALALAAEVSMGKALAACRRAGRNDRKGITMPSFIAAAEELGLTLTRVDPALPLAQCKTVGKLTQAAGPGTIVVTTATHMATIIDGVCHDHIGQRSKRRVEHVFIVHPNNNDEVSS